LIEPKLLIRRLDSSGVAALGEAVASAVKRGHDEVTVEHMLAALLAQTDSEVAWLADHFYVRSQLEGALRRPIDQRRRGNADKPVLSAYLLRWFQARRPG